MRLGVFGIGMAVTLLSSSVASGFCLPDETRSVASSDDGCIFVVPDGSGPSLASQGLTITVTVQDQNLDPIAGYPYQDIYVLSSLPYLDSAFCNQGSTADANSDAAGLTTISRAMAAGGHAERLQVYIAGIPLLSPPLNIRMVSPDQNADYSVNMSDVVDFAARYQSASVDWIIDFDCDGAETLLDVIRLAAALGASCP